MLAATKFTANTALIAAADFVTKIFSYLFILFLARYISISDFGLYNFIVSFFYFFWVISDFGLQYLTTRSVACGDFKILNRSLATRFFMSFIVFTLCLATTFLLSIPADAKFLLIVYALSLFSLGVSEAILPIFRGIENYLYERLVLLSKNLFFIIIGAIIIYKTKSLLLLIFVYVLSELVAAAVAVYLSRKASFGLRIEFLKIHNFSLNLLKQSLPLIIGISMLIFYYKIDSIMLKLIKGNYALGIYSSAFRIYEALLFIPVAIHVTILPKLIKIEKESFSAATDKVVKITLLIASLISILIIGYSTYVPILYGREGYQALIEPLRIIFLVTPLAFVNYIFIAIAYVEKKEVKVILPLFLTMMLNVVANYYYIPKYSYIAAAWTTNVSEVLLFILINYFVLSNFSRKIVTVIKFYLAYIASLSLFYLVGYSIFLPFLALAINCLLLYVLKVFNTDDFNILRKIFFDIVNSLKRNKGVAEN